MSKIYEHTMQTLFPERCASCGTTLETVKEASHARFLCAECEKNLLFRTPPFCEFCYQSIDRCNCRKKYHAIDGFTAPFYYYGSAKNAMMSLKFSNNIGASKFFSNAMKASIETDFFGIDFDILTCVPSTRMSLIKRGYNQSQVLAENMGLEIFHDYNLLGKRNDTAVQHEQKAAMLREKNIENAYFLRKNRAVIGKTILLIDDIYTTGSTCDACARALKLAGARAVYVACATRTLNKNKED